MSLDLLVQGIQQLGSENAKFITKFCVLFNHERCANILWSAGGHSDGHSDGH